MFLMFFVQMDTMKCVHCPQEGWVPTHWVGGEEGGFKKIVRGGQPATPNSWGKSILLGESGTVVPPLTNAALLGP